MIRMAPRRNPPAGCWAAASAVQPRLRECPTAMGALTGRLVLRGARGGGRALCRADRRGRAWSSGGHADGLHPRAGPGLSDHRRAAAAGRERWRAPRQVVKQAIDIIMKTPGSSMSRRLPGWTRPRSRSRRTPGRSSRACRRCTDHELKGVTANSVLADLRRRLSVIEDAYVLTIPPPPVQGLGSAGGFKMMLQDQVGLGSQALVRCGEGAGWRGQQGSRFRRRVHPAQHRLAVGLCRYRPREGGEGRADAHRCVLHAAGLSRLAIRQRLQPARPHLRGDRAGRRAVPPQRAGHHRG